MMFGMKYVLEICDKKYFNMGRKNVLALRASVLHSSDKDCC